VLGPRLRFLRERVTPGELGLELTTAGAVAATGLYVFVLYTVVLSGDLGPTPLDSELLDVAGELRSEPLVEAARIFTELGSLPMAAALVVGACTLLVMRRRLADFLVLSLGSVLVFLAVHVTKDSLDRPRPGEPLTDTMLSAYPSGHAAYATAWVAVAVILTRRLGLFSQAAVVTIALVIAAGVGASRVYLRVHWGSDVAGGWGLGVGLFALLGVVVLVVEYIRHNGAERTPAAGAPEQR
jgi:undecaprenyl-diphosphatase